MQFVLLWIIVVVVKEMTEGICHVSRPNNNNDPSHEERAFEGKLFSTTRNNAVELLLCRFANRLPNLDAATTTRQVSEEMEDVSPHLIL